MFNVQYIIYIGICGKGQYNNPAYSTQDVGIKPECLPCPYGTYQPIDDAVNACLHCPDRTFTKQNATEDHSGCVCKYKFEFETL